MLVALLFAGESAVGQQDVHATMLPQANRVAAPAFKLQDASGAYKQVADYRGKVVLLNFWATECGGCKLEIPWFIELASAHKADSFLVVGISMDTSYESLSSASDAWGKVKPFVQSQKMNYPVLMGDYTLLASYKVAALPVTYLIDKQGKIAAAYGGVVSKSDVDSNIDKLLAEP